MSSASVLEELNKLPLRDHIEPCSLGGLEQLAPLGRFEDHAKEDVLFNIGQPADALRFIVAGRVALYVSDPRGQTHIVGTASKGDMLGWSALRSPTATWTVSARATRDTRCLVFPADDVRALCERDKPFGYCLVRYVFEGVARRLTDARLQLLDVYGG